MDLEKLKRCMHKRNLDALIAVSQENVYYTSGALIQTQKDIRDRLAITLFPFEGDPLIIVCNIEESFTKEWTWIKDIRAYIEFRESPIAFLVEALKEKGLIGKRVGLEKNYLPTIFYEELTNLLPETNFINCEDVLLELRMIKSKEEIKLMEDSTKATLKAIEEAFAETKPGDTERQLFNRIAINLIQVGATNLPFIIVATGKKGAQAHPIPDNTQLLEGETLRVDCGGIFKGYYSDVARTVAIGKPANHQKEYYAKLQIIQKKVIDNMTVGTKCNELYQICADEFKKEGMQFHMPHIGHGLGLVIHEHPIISPLCETRLEEGMVINIEPFFIDQERKFGYHIEDLVEITKEGPRVLTGTNFNTEIPTIE
jgi:Xaa-Pro aminopeptidase